MSAEKLDDVLKSLTNSVLEAQKLTEQQHQRQIRRYFMITPSSPADRGKDEEAKEKGEWQEGHPRTQTFCVPDLRADSEEEYREIQVPEMALAPPTTIHIKELKINFKVGLRRLGPDEKGIDPVHAIEKTHRGAPEVDLNPDAGPSSGVATIDVTFQQAKTPDAYHRLTDLLSKAIP